MRAIGWIAVCLAMLLAGGCDSSNHQGGKNAPKVWRTCVSLAPGSTEVIAMGTEGFVRVLGRTESCNFPAQVMQAPVVMAGVKPNYEKIRDLKPDGVLYDSDLFSESDIAKFKELGIETLDLGGHSLDEFCENVRRLSTRCRGETKYSEYIDKIEAVRQLKTTTAPTPAVKMAVLMAGNGSEHMICGTKSFLADCVRAAGAVSVGPEAPNFVPLSAEAFLAMNPDVIVVTGDPTSVARDPRFQSLKAVKTKRVFGVNPDLALRHGFRVDALITALYDLSVHH